MSPGQVCRPFPLARGRVRRRPARSFRIEPARKLEQIVVLGARQGERLRDAAERLGGSLHRAPLLDPRAPGHADAGERGEFLAPETRGSPPSGRAVGRTRSR